MTKTNVLFVSGVSRVVTYIHLDIVSRDCRYPASTARDAISHRANHAARAAEAAHTVPRCLDAATVTQKDGPVSMAAGIVWLYIVRTPTDSDVIRVTHARAVIMPSGVSI